MGVVHPQYQKVYDEKVKPVLREPPTSDIPQMLRKLEFYSGWGPYLAEQAAKAERFLKIAKAQALADCPFNSPEYKVKVWLEGEIVDVDYFYNHLHAVHAASKDSAIQLQTAINIEVDIQAIKTTIRKDDR